MEVIKDMDNRLFTQLVLGMNRQYGITFTGEIISPIIEAEIKRRYGVTPAEMESEINRRGFRMISKDNPENGDVNNATIFIDESIALSRIDKLIRSNKTFIKNIWKK